MPVLRLADVKDPTDIGVSDRASQPHFRGEPGERLTRPPSKRGQQFQCNRFSQPKIVSAIDLTAGSASKEADDAEALREDPAGHKSRTANLARIERINHSIRIVRDDSCRRCPRLA